MLLKKNANQVKIKVASQVTLDDQLIMADRRIALEGTVYIVDSIPSFFLNKFSS